MVRLKSLGSIFPQRGASTLAAAQQRSRSLSVPLSPSFASGTLLRAIAVAARPLSQHQGAVRDVQWV
jgi:hypothetical protein